MAKQQTKPAVKSSTPDRVTKTFPTYDKPVPQTQHTVDSLKKLGYVPDPNSVKRIPGTSSYSASFVKPKKK